MNKDIILAIEKINEWSGISSWINVSQYHRSLFLKKDNLCMAIDKYNSASRFPSWVLNSIPLTEYLEGIVPEKLKNLSKTMMDRLGVDMLDKINGDKFFVTGGFAVNCIFDTPYSDIDIWIPTKSNATKSNVSREKEGNLDKIFDDNIETSISNFDLSCCQVGVLFEKSGGVAVPIRTYFTPLFLYTLYTGDIISNVVPLVLNYSVTLPQGRLGEISMNVTPYTVDIMILYSWHIRHNETGLLKGTRWYSEEELNIYREKDNLTYINNVPQYKFSDCLQCKSYIKSRCCDSYDNIMRWFDRLKKYEDRFSKSMKKNYVIEKYVKINRRRAKVYGEKSIIEIATEEKKKEIKKEKKKVPKLPPFMIELHTEGCVECQTRKETIKELYQFHMTELHEIEGRDMTLDQLYEDCIRCYIRTNDL